jgi:hypothetical protein
MGKTLTGGRNVRTNFFTVCIVIDIETFVILQHGAAFYPVQTKVSPLPLHAGQVSFSNVRMYP